MQGTAEQASVESIRSAHPEKVSEAKVLGPNLISISVRREDLLEIAISLRDRFGFSHPVSASGVDWLKENRMQVIYYIEDPSTKLMLTLRVELPRDNPRIPTMTGVWEAMNFHERETREMLGIEFEGHPNPMNLLLPPDWRGGYPLRKDFKGEGVQP